VQKQQQRTNCYQKCLYTEIYKKYQQVADSNKSKKANKNYHAVKLNKQTRRTCFASVL